MNDINPTAPPPPDIEAQKTPEMVKWIQHIGSGTGWLFLIAALSAVNSIIAVFGGELVFVVGLGITQVIDSLGFLIAAEAQNLSTLIKLVALALSLVPSIILGLFGFFGRKGQGWAFTAAAVVYGIDAVLVTVFGDFAGALFHLLGLFYIIRGAVAASRIKSSLGKA